MPSKSILRILQLLSAFALLCGFDFSEAYASTAAASAFHRLSDEKPQHTAESGEEKDQSFVDELGRVTQTEYDGAGRAVLTRLPALADGTQAVTQTQYDGNGNVVAAIDATGNRTDVIYDACNRKLRSEGPAVLDAATGVTTRPMTDWDYDGVGNVVKVTDARNYVTTTQYDAANRKIRVTAPAVPVPGNGVYASPVTQNVYDAVGNVLQVIDPDGYTTTNTYDQLNRLTATTDAAGITVRYAYDHVSNRTSVTDGNNHVTTFSYDGLKRNTSVTDALSHQTQFAYDGLNKISRRDATGQVTTYGYDARNRLHTVNYGAGSPENRTYNYDAAGRLVTVTDGQGGLANVAYSYDALNHVVSETSVGLTHQYGYDLNGNRLSTQYGGTGRTLVSAYDALNRLSTVTESPNLSGGRVTHYGYDLNGNVAWKQLPNGDMVTTEYDALNREAVISGTNGAGNALYLYANTHDLAGNAVGIWEQTADLPARVLSMVYDADYRLTSETATTNPVPSSGAPSSALASPAALAADPGAVTAGSGGETVATVYVYDSGNNRTHKTVTTTPASSSPSAVATTYTYNNANQLTASSEPGQSSSYVYDANGSRTSWTLNGASQTTYNYDPEHRLTSLTEPGHSYSYTYDYRTRRVRRVEDGVATNVVFSGGESVQEIQGSLTTVEYVRGSDWGGGVGGILYTMRGGSPSFTHYDSRGDVTTKTDGGGSVTYQASYQAFGTRPEEFSSTLDRQKASTKEEDPTGLLNEGMRYRDLTTDTFITADPAGFVDGPNLYAYVRQNPWTHFDPEGLAGSGNTEEDEAEEPPPIRGHMSLGNGWYRSPLGTEYFPTGGGVVYRNRDTGRLDFIRGAESLEPPPPISIPTEQLAKWEARFGPYREIGEPPKDNRSPEEVFRDKLAAEQRTIDYYTRRELESAKTNAKLAALAKEDALRDMKREGIDVDPKTGEYRGGEGVIYKVPGSGTPSGKPYIGSADNLEKRDEKATDGRDRSQAEVVGRYPIGDKPARKDAEQDAIDEHGGLSKLDNKRNEKKRDDK